jgi:hypothetical protein
MQARLPCGEFCIRTVPVLARSPGERLNVVGVDETGGVLIQGFSRHVFLLLVPCD